MPVRRGDVPPGTAIPTQPAYATGRPIVRPPGPGTSTGPRQPPTPPPSGVVEPPEPTSDPAAEPGNLGPELEGQGRCRLDGMVGASFS